MIWVEPTDAEIADLKTELEAERMNKANTIREVKEILIEIDQQIERKRLAHNTARLMAKRIRDDRR